jgi:hypothetical protein
MKRAYQQQCGNRQLNRLQVVPLTFKATIHWQNDNFPQAPHLREVVLWPSL